MAKWIALHTLKKSPEEFSAFWSKYVEEVARAFAQGEVTARATCAKSWNSVPQGRNHLFCLWEADKPEDIMADLEPLFDWITIDLYQVEEVDWAEEVAKAGG